MVQTRSMADPTASADLPPACCTRSRTKATAGSPEHSKKRPREEGPDDQDRRPTKKPAVTKPRAPVKTARRTSKKATTARKPSKIVTPGTTIARPVETASSPSASSSRKRARTDDEVDERPNKKPAPSPLPEPRVTRSRAAAQKKAKVAAAAAAAQARRRDSAVDVDDDSGPVVASANGAKPPGGGSSGEESDPRDEESDDTYESSASSDSSEETETEAEEESGSESEESGSGSEEEGSSSGSGEESNPNSNVHVPPSSNYTSDESDSASTDSSSSALPPSTNDGDVLPPRGALLCEPCLSELLVSHFRARRLQQLRAGRLQAPPPDAYTYSEFATSLRNGRERLANNAAEGGSPAFSEFDSKLAAAAENASLTTSLVDLTLPNDRLADELAHWDANSIVATIGHLWRAHSLGTAAGSATVSRCGFRDTLQAECCYQCLDTPSGHGGDRDRDEPPVTAEDDKDHFRTFEDVAWQEGMTLEQLAAVDVRLFRQLLHRKYGYPLCFCRRGVCLAVDPCGARPFVVFLGVDKSG